jgi:chromosome segregation ATPase
MTPEQQMNAANKLIKRLKDTLSDLARAKSDFITQATIAEKNARSGWANTLEIAQLLDEERTYFKRKLKQMETDNNIWKDNAKDSMRELSVVEDKLQSQQDEIEHLRKKVIEAEAATTQAKIALQVEKARMQDMEKQYNRNDISAVSISNLESVKAQVRKDTEKELRQTIQAEKLSLRDEVRRCETRIRSLESQLSLGETQLARAVAEAEVGTSILLRFSLLSFCYKIKCYFSRVLMRERKLKIMI